MAITFTRAFIITSVCALTFAFVLEFTRRTFAFTSALLSLSYRLKMCHSRPEDLYKVPDYRIYKVENAEPLVQVRKDLAKLGLKDPWLRNEVWRYNVKVFSTPWRRFIKGWTRGMITGSVCAVLTVLATNAYYSYYGDPFAYLRENDEDGHSSH